MFQLDMACGDFKDLGRRTASDKVLKNKAFNIAKNLKMMDVKQVLLLWFNNVLMIKNSGSGVNQNEHPFDLAMKQLSKELHKPIIRIFKRRTVYFSFKRNIWCVHLADMQLI